MATKITTGLIDSGAITSALITDGSITATDLHTTLDLTGKTVTVATATAGDNDTTVASTAFVSTAIANLADSAPETLNTLNELAAALGDDANFSTTVTNSIALKAPLASPTFTGTVEIPNLTISSAQGSDGQVLTSTGSGIAWEAVPAGTTINNNADNRIITGSGTANTLEGESNLTFDGTTTVINNTGNADSTLLKLTNTPSTAGTYKTGIEFWSNEGTAANQTFNAGRIYSEFNGSNYSNAGLTLGSALGGGTFNDELTLRNGNVGIGTASPDSTLEVNGPMSIRSSNYLSFGQSNTSIDTWTTRQYASGSSHQFNAQTFSFNRTGYASDELLYMDTNGMYVSPINHGHARMNSLSSTSLAASAGDWIDIATIPYGRNTAKVKFLWDGVSSPSSAHHGMMEFAIGSHYGTSYYYGWDSYIHLLSSSAHNDFHIEEARIITPNGSGATGVFQVRFQNATTAGVWRSYVTERDESCTIQPLTPVVNNSRTGTTIARLDLSAAKGGAVTSRVHMAVSKDLHVQGGITIANQPGFSAYKNGNINETAGDTIIGNWVERYDTGGKFNHTSGRFTATTKGKYLFTMGMMAGQTTGDVQYKIFKNGAIYAGSNSMAQGGGPWRFTTVVATVHLEATDYVDFIAFSSTNSNNQIVYTSTYSHVSGHFLG
jgi:hypothetical protein